MTPLGNIASNVTPPLSHGEGAPLAEPLRRLKWRLRDHAGRMLPKQSIPGLDGVTRERLHRVARCGRHILGGQVAVVAGEGGARFLGLETCGSVWLCPVCSSKIAEHRRADIEAMLTAHCAGQRRRFTKAPGDTWGGAWETYQAAPGAVYMATFTVPHGRWDSLERLRDDVAECWRRVQRGAAWARLKARCGIVGVIRAMELTHGANGWHPHLHVLILAKPGACVEMTLRHALYARWAAFVGKMGLGVVSETHGVDLYRAHSVQAAGDYVAKWGCDAELTKWHVKKGRGKNRSPWQLLAAAAEGDVEARIRWREFAAVMPGTCHITMSHGLRDLYLDGPELSDAEIAALEHGIDPAEIVRNTGETIVGHIRRGVWVRVMRAGLAVDVLEAVETGGWAAALFMLADRGLALRRAGDG